MQGSYIGIMADDSPGLFTGILAILKSGNCFVPINPLFPDDRIRFIINDCKISLLLTDKTNYQKGRQVAAGSPCVKHILCIDDIPGLGIEETDKGKHFDPFFYCYVIYTSGSTGRPKGVPITHGNLIPLFYWFRDYFGLGVHTRVMQNLSYTFDFGIFEIFTTLLFGGSVYVVNKNSVSDFSSYTYFINRQGINTLHTTPVFFNNITNSGRQLSFIKLLHLGGERLTGKMVRNASAVLPPGCHIYNGYGPTEATINSTIFCIPEKVGETTGEEAAVPIGRPSAFNEIYIMDQYNNLQPIGIGGELCVAGTGLASGYLNRPELTIKNFWRSAALQNLFSKRFLAAGGIFYRTGDLARWLPGGDIEFLGRIDHQVKVRGFRIELGEIENCLLKHPDIKEAVVIASEHENGSNYLCAYIVTCDLQSLAVSQLREHLSRELPDYMIPAYFIPVEKIPLTASGKIDRKALPGPDETVIETGIAYAAPVTDMEKKLVFIWQQLLRVERIGINDDFFELGGDSILVNQCIARIREELLVEIPLRKFFERPYIKALAEEIARQEQRVSAIKPIEREEEIPLSFAQERLWFLQELDAGSAAYFVPRVIRLKGKLDVTLIERTFSEIIRRHEILRTTFPTVDGRPVQCIHPPYVFKIPVMDWSKEAEEHQNQKVFEFLEQEGRQSFDFENGPLLRVTLLKLKEEEHLFVLTEHHLVHDGWTQGVLLKEFITIFTAYSEGKEHQLPQLPIQYADYAVWQREFLKGKILERHLDYWKEKLAGLEPVLELPADRPRLPVISGKGALQIFHLSDTFTRELKAFSRANGTTLFMTMLAVFKTLLHRYTDVEDLCVGTGIANRKYREMEGMLGMVINTLPLRSRAAGDIPFREYLQQVKVMCLEAYQHEDTPFGKIVAEIKPERNLSYTPIFQVLFSFMDTPTHDLRLPGLKLEVEPTHNRSSKFDINVVVVPPEDDSGETLVEWEYNTDIFDASTIDRMTAHFTRLLEEVVSTSEEKLSNLAMLSEQETRQLLYAFNDTASAYPSDKTIHRLFEEQVERAGDHIAVQHRTYRTYRTYKKLSEESNKLAALLLEKGVQPGNIVGILGERSVEMVTGILAILKAGGAYLPIDADYPEERIQYMLADSGTKVLLTDLPGKHRFNCQLSIVNCQLLMSPAPNPPTHPTHLTHLSYIMYTSGSTGQPKGVMVTHRNVVRLVKNTNYVPLTQETRILQTGAPVFDATTFEIWGSLLSGGQLVLVDKEVILDVRQLGNALIDCQVNTLWLSAPLFNQLMQQDIELFAPLRYLLVGGDVLSPPHINRVKQRFPGLKIVNGYGPTENTTFSTTYSIEKEFGHNIPIGRPISNSTAYIYDKNNQLVPVGVWGELVVGGDGVSLGYLNSPELTAERFDRFNRSYRSYIFYRTGDLARWLSNGTIEFKGRLDQQVKIRGYRIELGEIENHLLKHEGVKEAVVIDRKDQGEKYLCAYVVPHGTHGAGSREQGKGGPALKEFLSQTLPGYMIPSFFISIDRIPLNPNGKIDRKLLPEPVVQGTETAEECTAPRDTVEKKLADIWAEVLNIHTAFGIDDNFFDLGGHSLNATLLVARMHKIFHVKIPLMEFLKKGCIREVAQYIKEAARETFTAIEPTEKKEYYPLSAAQKRLYILYQLDDTGVSYNIPSMHLLHGAVDKNHLETVFKRLVERHDSFRTSFIEIAEEPVQRMHKKVNFKIEDHIPVNDFVRPFDLAQAPLLRVGLNKTNDHEYFLMVDMHHIISDGTSHSILVKELVKLYMGEELPFLRIQYKDYSEWKTGTAEMETVKQQERFWQHQFEEEPPVLNIPLDYPRSLIQSFEGNRVKFEIGSEETRALKECASGEGATLYMVLLAVVNVFLAKITGQEDIVVGSPIAARRHADLEPVIGMFVNTLALRNYPTMTRSFHAFLKEVKENTLSAYENQDYPFEELVEVLDIERDASRNPLFDVLFALQNIEQYPARELPGLSITPYPYENKTAKFDLYFAVLEKEEKLAITLEYSTRLFRRDTIRRMVGFFKQVVNAVIENPDVTLAEIRITGVKEKQEILRMSQGPAEALDRKGTIHRWFEKKVDSSADKTALVFKNQHLTYKVLNRKANQLARQLKAKGVGPDTVVGLMVERSLNMVIGILGIMKAGGAYLPIDPDYPEARKKYMLRDSGVGLVLTHFEMERLIPTAPGTVEMIDTRNPHLYTGENGDLAHRDTGDGTHLVYVIYTSGSTGKPKGIMLEHRNLLNLMRYQFDYTEIPFDRVLQFTTISFDVSFQEIFSTLLAGGTLYLIDKETRDNIDELFKIIEENEIETLFLPASFLKFVLNEEDCIDRMPRSVRHIITAGEQVVVSPRFRGYLKRSRVWLHNHYGPAETHVVTALAMDPAGRIPELPPIGKPVLNTAIYILDRQNNLQPIGVPGEIVIAGAQVGRGYWRKKTLTSERFVDNLFAKGEKMYRTGDLGRWLPAGNIEFLGRADQQVKIRGFRIEMGEIEHQLLAYEAVKEAVVILREADTGEKYLCAYVVPHGTHGVWGMGHGVGGPALKEFLSQTLPDYMIPSFFITLEKIPLNPNGKLDRRALPAPEMKIDAHDEYTAPTNKIEEDLATIWADILGVEKNVIGIDSNFFQLGGHSLKATILIARVHKRLRVKIPLPEFFKNPTIRELSQYAAGVMEDIYTGPEPVEKKEYYVLSPAQKRLYILHQMDKHGVGYNLPSVLELEGGIDKNRLENTFKKLLERHESLSTFFITVNGEPAQIIHEEINFTIEYKEAANSLISQFIRPFDLAKAPLLRMALLEKEKGKYLVIIDMHHIISDGMSLGIFVTEFMALYGGKVLISLKVQYKDYSEWSHKEKEKVAYRQQAEYWQKQFEGEIPVLELPTDFVRPREQGFEGSRVKFESTAAETQRLKALALKESTTLYMVLLAAFNVFLLKISNQETLVVGTPVAGRRHVDLEQIIGMFVNTLAVKHYPQSQKAFNRFLQEVNRKTLEAFENQDYPFEELVEKAAVKRDTARNPLFDVLFVLQNMDISEINIPGLKLRPYDYKSSTSKFDLMLQAVEVNENLVFTFEYSTRLFKEPTIRRFAGYFKKVLSTVVEKTAIKISNIEIIPEQEKKQLLYDFNDTAADYPGDKTIHQLFEEQVGKTPDYIALIGPIGPIGPISLSYKELAKKSGQLAQLLREKGVEPDTIVGIMAERSVEMIIGLLGTLKAGGAYLPIEPGYPEERINYMLTDSGARVLVTDLPEGHFFNCQLLIVNCQLLMDPAPNPPTHLTHPTHPTHLCYIIYTSGTTGKPKGVMIEHRNVVRLMFNDKFLFDFNCRDTWTMFHSCCFDFSVWEMYGALLYGGKLVIVPRMAARDSLGYLEILKENQVTILNQTPSAFYNLMDLELENPRRELNIRYVIFGGEALTPSRLKKWKAKYPAAKLINMYGITETTVHVTFKEITGKEIGSDASNIGRPIPTLSTYIIDKHLKPMPTGTPGELTVGGEGVGRGYLNRQELTGEKFVANPYKPGDKLYRSGDLAKFSSGGELEYLGRIDHQVKIRGFRVELGEIESRLLTYKPVKEAVVIDRKDQNGDKYLCAYVVPHGTHGAWSMEHGKEGPALKEFLSRTLPDYMIPPHFVIMDHIPLTNSGKIDRNALPEPGIESYAEYTAPRNDTEEKLTEIWAEILEINKNDISIDANFFDLGGHSLKATIMISKIKKILNTAIPLADVFEKPTIREMAGCILPAAKNQFLHIEPAEEKEFYPLTPMQNQFFVLDQLQTVKTAYNLPSVLTVEGKLDRRKLEEAILKLIRRHATLRTSFVIADEKPVQRIHPEVDFELKYHKLFGPQTEVEFIKNFIRPFDLSCAPLLRVGLLMVEEEKHILIFDMHHIISDGTSLGILVQDIVTLYEGNQRPPLPIQYKDYSQWLSSPGGKETIARQETYWLDQYNGPLPVLNMYTDHPRPPVQSFKGDAILFSMGKTLTQKIRQLTAGTGVTLFMLLLAALNVLLSRYSAQEDIVVGTPIAGRVHADFEDIIALFINVLPIRNFPHKDKTFRQFLMEVKENTIKAYENQGYPFETLLEKLNVEKDLARNPLFDVELVVLNMDAPTLETKGLKFTPYRHKLDVSQVDIDIYVAEYEEDIRANLMYCTDLFKKKTIEGFIAFFKEILSTAADNTEVTLKDIEMSHHLAAAQSHLIQDDTDDFEF